MALSLRTLNYIDTLSHESVPAHVLRSAVFVGGLYEPRITILNQIKVRLLEKGRDLIMFSRDHNAPRIPDDHYWAIMKHAGLIITTSEQNQASMRDWADLPHLIYRYTEALACGTLLVAPHVPAIERYFIPDREFVVYHNPEHAAEIIDYYLSNSEARDRIAALGKAKARALIESGTFWTTIDTMLSRQAMK